LLRDCQPIIGQILQQYARSLNYDDLTKGRLHTASSSSVVLSIRPDLDGVAALTPVNDDLEEMRAPLRTRQFRPERQLIRGAPILSNTKGRRLQSVSLRFLCSILGTARDPVAHATEIHGTSDQVVLHTRTILRSASSDQHHRMLLYVVPFSRNVCRNDRPTAQSYSSNFPLSRVWLLRLCSSHAQAHAFHLRSVDERRRHRSARFLADSAPSEHLVVSRLNRGRAGEGSFREGSRCDGGREWSSQV